MAIWCCGNPWQGERRVLLIFSRISNCGRSPRVIQDKRVRWLHGILDPADEAKSPLVMGADKELIVAIVSDGAARRADS